MGQSAPSIRNISDTALWAAVYRARETDRPDAVFRDPFARRLAGERGERIAQSFSSTTPFGVTDWTWLARTYLFDSFITEVVQQGADLIINLAAGLDARPYRMDLPASLRWIEVDLPDILSYKEEILRRDKPVCSLERVPLDLSNRKARGHVLGRLCEGASQALIVTEGFVIYLTAEEVGALAQDLGAILGVRHWVLDLVSPGLLRRIQKIANPQLAESSVSLKFGPEEGPHFFERYRWTPVDVRSPLKTAAHLKRLPFLFRLMSLLPETKGKPGNRPWSGICLLKNQMAGPS
jgi:methyltransferase (TIGR00027 family)